MIPTQVGASSLAMAEVWPPGIESVEIVCLPFLFGFIAGVA